jgi:hypothetical protein
MDGSKVFLDNMFHPYDLLLNAVSVMNSFSPGFDIGHPSNLYWRSQRPALAAIPPVVSGFFFVSLATSSLLVMSLLAQPRLSDIVAWSPKIDADSSSQL